MPSPHPLWRREPKAEGPRDYLERADDFVDRLDMQSSNHPTLMVAEFSDVAMSTKRFGKGLPAAGRVSYQPQLAFRDPNQPVVVYLSIHGDLSVIATVVRGDEFSQ